MITWHGSTGLNVLLMGVPLESKIKNTYTKTCCLIYKEYSTIQNRIKPWKHLTRRLLHSKTCLLIKSMNFNFIVMITVGQAAFRMRPKISQSVEWRCCVKASVSHRQHVVLQFGTRPFSLSFLQFSHQEWGSTATGELFTRHRFLFFCPVCLVFVRALLIE